jgi:hypothetical protein
MYFVMIGLLLVALPAGSVAVDLLRHSHDHLSVLLCVGRWWTFWAVGIRLLLAGARQSFSLDLQLSKSSGRMRPPLCQSCAKSDSETLLSERSAF